MTPYAKPGIKDIDDIIAEVFGTTKSAMTAKAKGTFIVSDARKFAMWYRITELKETQFSSGSKYNRDHATALHAKNTFNGLMETDKVFRGKSENALRKLEPLKL